nr:eukaryotic peptide chain release factor subunit 1-like [Lepeophtheirus salmonis]
MLLLYSSLPEEDQELQQLKIYSTLKSLNRYSGSGTSIISLILPPKDQIHRAIKLLMTEQNAASNIKSRVNRLSVQNAISSAIVKLKSLREVPTNGLAIFSGAIMENKKEKRICLAIEPIDPINTSLYLCDSKFHVQNLVEQFNDSSKYGIVIITGHESIFAELCGNSKKILQSITVDLPKKHGRGGQSSVRFARLRVEKRNAYVKKVAEISNNIFNTAEYEGFIIGGYASLKNEFSSSDFLDKEITNKILKVVDTNYSGINGLNQAIELSQDTLINVKYNKERNIINTLFDEISTNGKYTLGFEDVYDALINSTVERIILNCDLEKDVKFDDYINSLNNGTTEGKDVISDDDNDLNDLNDCGNVIDFFSMIYKKYDAKLSLVSDKTSEGTQFLEAFGGIGAVLKYSLKICR